MTLHIGIVIIIPLLGFLCSLLPHKHQEKTLFSIALLTVGLSLLYTLGLAIDWAMLHFQPIYQPSLVLYASEDVHFSLDWFFDLTSIVYGVTAATITLMVVVFSRRYMHRDPGYKRFFNNLTFFFLGLNTIIFAGNFETLFIGWEVIGIASFLLIAFYRERYLPVKNALKVVSLYRLADIALLLAIWLCHHAFSHSINFLELSDLEAHHTAIIQEAQFQFWIPTMFLIVALVKSAQLPFSSWLPRAMEGPTVSSAIFYGSLSVHMGAFLLLRTAPLWQDNLIFSVILGIIGLKTSIVATLISRVQSSAKTQIAYASVAQIGLIFVEIALGYSYLALWHFVGNAFLRTYQLLVSPSLLSYWIHDQFFHFTPPNYVDKKSWWGKIRLTLYILAIKEFNLDHWQRRYLWQPLKTAGRYIDRLLPRQRLLPLVIPIFSLGLYGVYHKSLLPLSALGLIPEINSLIALALVLKAFAARQQAQEAWLTLVFSQLFVSLSIGYNEQFDFGQIHLYLSGIILAGGIGYFCFEPLRRHNKSTHLNQFRGYVQQYPSLAVVFLLACLGLSGFPITPTFIGEDLMFGHIHENQWVLTLLTALNFILDGLATYRIYARIFMGIPTDTNQATAYHNS